MQRIALLIILLVLLLVGCDNVEDGIVDPNGGSFVVENLEAPAEVKYSGGTTKVTTSISFSDSESITNIWLNVISLDGRVEIIRNLEMTNPDQNDLLKFAASFGMEKEYPSIVYTIEYFYSTNIQSNKKIASHNFNYYNLQDNIAPEISNPLFYYEEEDPILRDTLENNRPFILSIEASDDNGIADIDSVYTYFYSPNNPAPLRVLMFDDGNPDNGDEIAGDGIYSFKNIFSNAVGERKFEFRAKDRAGTLSNLITHTVVLKNIAPEISNPLIYYEEESPILRDTLENNKPFILSINVWDDNGLVDVDTVYSDFYAPNNPAPVRVLMFDDGNPDNGDKVAGDGIYSFKNIFSNAVGERRFEFRARDRAGALSNILEHTVVVK